MINYQPIWLFYSLSVAKCRNCRNCRNCRSIFDAGDNGRKKAGYVPGFSDGVRYYIALVLKVRTCPVLVRSSSR